jgi:hypothetical protein
MNRSEIQEKLEEMLSERRDYFTAPYGILTSDHISGRGFPCKSVTFGCARTLDAEVRIFNANFIQFRSSRNPYGSKVFKSFEALLEHFREEFPGAKF